MEKWGTLINRLQEQYQQQASESRLLNTALLLVSELQAGTASTEAKHGSVSVIMPYKPFDVITKAEVVTEEKKDSHADETLTEVIANNILPESMIEPLANIELQPEPEPESIPEPVAEPALPEPVQTFAINKLAEEKYNEVMDEVPTLAQQQPKVLFELNDTVPGEPSINDKLKQQVPETGGRLQNEPIRDLRKAIGINDKYLFMRELFRNDEVAYERSIKTINSFSILPEAEYWIQREMKYKLGWDDDNTTVKAFYQLVKRRFS